MTQIHTIGDQITYFEEPDIIVLKLRGEVSEEEGMELNRLNREFGQGREHVFFLIDLEEMSNLPPKVRKVATETLHQVPTRGVAICKAPFKARVIAKLIVTALNMFRREAAKDPVEFLDSEQEARAWIDKRRQEIAGVN
jgi:hypothetical protein